VGAAQVALMRRLKNAFDPAGILNPGKKIPAESQAPLEPPVTAATLETAAAL
jgi:hypothetical protein